MANRLQQLLAASMLIAFVERLAAEGKLTEADETQLRVLTVKFCNAFEILTLAERPANSNDDLDYQLDAMTAELAKNEDQPA